MAGSNKTAHIRLKKSTIDMLRKVLPNASSDDSRIRTLYDASAYKFEPLIDAAGSAVWGSNVWNKLKKKKR